MSRVYHPLRNLFDVFDRWNLNDEEKENHANIQTFKDKVRSIVRER